MGRVDRGSTVTRAERLGEALRTKKRYIVFHLSWCLMQLFTRAYTIHFRDMIRASKRRKAAKGVMNDNDAWGGIVNDKDET